MNVIAVYGRKYTNIKAARADWFADNDFKIIEPLKWDDIDWDVDAPYAESFELNGCIIQVVTVDHGEE